MFVQLLFTPASKLAHGTFKCEHIEFAQMFPRFHLCQHWPKQMPKQGHAVYSHINQHAHIAHSTNFKFGQPRPFQWHQTSVETYQYFGLVFQSVALLGAAMFGRYIVALEASRPSQGLPTTQHSRNISASELKYIEATAVHIRSTRMYF